MSKRSSLVAFITILISICGFLYFGTNHFKRNMDKQNEFIKPNKEQRIAGRFEQEFEATKDPRSGTVPRERLVAARTETQRLLSTTRAISNVDWEERGPNNVGGRTRAILVDLNDTSNNLGHILMISLIILLYLPLYKIRTILILCISEQEKAGLIQMLLEEWAFGNQQMNGGNTWTQVIGAGVGIGSTNRAADLELGADGDIYVSIGIFSTGAIFKSTTGAPNTWTDITPTGSFRRIELATAPSNANRIYALCQGSSSSDVTDIFSSSNGGNTWTAVTVPDFCDQGNTEIFTRGQAWYDLIAAVDPSDEDILYIGGVDALRSDDGGNNWTQITSWTRGFGCAGLGVNQYVHADHHAIVFEHGNNPGIIWGTDGGISHTTNGAATLPTFTTKNSNYNITQFYTCALHPTAGSNYFLAGAQDNGTQKFTTVGVNSTTAASGGDGAFCHIDQDDPDVQITAFVRNLYFVSINGGTSFTYKDFNGTTGRFINPTDYDNTANKLYGGDDDNTYFRWNDPATAGDDWDQVSVSNLGTITAVSVSPNVNNRVYFGNDAGEVVRVDNAHIGATKTGTVLVANSGTVSSIAIEEGKESHILVTYSNYGVASIYESSDGGITWTNIENNLPDMPVRSVIFSPKDADQAFIATELGVWSTDDLDGTNTEWTPTNTGLANVRADMLQARTSDDLIAVATHGRGLYTAINYGTSGPNGNYSLWYL